VFADENYRGIAVLDDLPLQVQAVKVRQANVQYYARCGIHSFEVEILGGRTALDDYVARSTEACRDTLSYFAVGIDDIDCVELVG
jgi:hypothetical protein